MNMLRFLTPGIAVAALAVAIAPAQATQIPDGTVSIANNFSPSVTLGSTTNIFSAAHGLTFEITGTGGFLGASEQNGHLNGSFDFSSLVGTTVDQTLADFFVFSDGQGGTYDFSLSSVYTKAYTNANGSIAIALYLLGSTIDTNLGYTATDTSLTLTFNSTNGSAYSSSATLAVPPSGTGDVPEPATWAMTVLGFGAMGAALRRRPRVSSVSFA